MLQTLAPSSCVPAGGGGGGEGIGSWIQEVRRSEPTGAHRRMGQWQSPVRDAAEGATVLCILALRPPATPSSQVSLPARGFRPPHSPTRDMAAAWHLCPWSCGGSGSEALAGRTGSHEPPAPEGGGPAAPAASGGRGQVPGHAPKGASQLQLHSWSTNTARG